MSTLNSICTFLFSCILLLHLSIASAVSSQDVDSSIPSPLSILPTQSWDGNDGPWSSFNLRVGSPPQNVRVLISTASNQPWVVLSEGCSSCDSKNCSESRGGTFHSNESSTWTHNNASTKGLFTLSIDADVGSYGNGRYGYDSIALGSEGSGSPLLADQVISGITTKDLYTGYFGLNPSATQFSANSSLVPSYMGNLKAKNMIPSLSYGYTAGNFYRSGKTFGSLTIGGYDASLFEPNNLTIDFTRRDNLELFVNVESVEMSSKNGNTTLSSNSFQAIIDSTIPYLYLPIEVCQRFEEAFGIAYDEATELYLVNDTLHQKLLDQSANIVLRLTNSTEEVVVDITLPYLAFDLTASYPLVRNATRYFPLKRALNSSQITLGRTFLQEAYLIADYSRSNFSIHQRRWETDAPSNIVTILPPGHKSNAKIIKPAPNSRSVYIIPIAIAGSIGGAILIIFLIGCIIVVRKHRLQNDSKPSMFQALPFFNTTLSQNQSLLPKQNVNQKFRLSPKPTSSRISRPMPIAPPPSPLESPTSIYSQSTTARISRPIPIQPPPSPLGGPLSIIDQFPQPPLSQRQNQSTRPHPRRQDSDLVSPLSPEVQDCGPYCFQSLATHVEIQPQMQIHELGIPTPNNSSPAARSVAGAEFVESPFGDGKGYERGAQRDSAQSGWDMQRGLRGGNGRRSSGMGGNWI